MGYFDDLIDGDAPVERAVEYRGKSKQVWFRRITAAERIQLLKGQTVTVGDGKGTTSLDLGALTANRHLLVRYSAMVPDGDGFKQAFNGLPEVQKLPDGLVAEMAIHAQAVNDDEGNG